MWGPETPEVTEPSRLVGESSGGEVRKQQLDTRVRQESPGGLVSGVGWGGQGAGTGLRAQGRPGATKVWAPRRLLAPAASPFVQWATKWALAEAPTCRGPGPLLHHGDLLPSADPKAQFNLGQPSASPTPRLPRQVVLLQPGLGRVLPKPGRAIPKLGGEKQLRAQSGIRVPEFSPQPPLLGFFRTA